MNMNNNIGKGSLFLHPKRWIGIFYALRDQVPDLDKVLMKVLRSFITDMLLPFVLLTSSILIIPSTSSTCYMQTIHQQNIAHGYVCFNSLVQIFPQSKLPKVTQIATTTMLSPFVLTSLYQQQVQIRDTIINRVKMWHALRIHPDEDAIECQNESIKKNTLLRKRQCDIYFPSVLTKKEKKSKQSKQSKTKNHDKHCEKQKVLLFLPGAFVDHTSYSVIANKLASRGIVVVVLSMEPLRLALRGLGADISDLQHVVKIAKHELLQRYGDHNIPIEWSIGGHSLGAYSAMRLSPLLHDQMKTSQQNLKIVIWAAGTNLRYVTDLSSFTQNEMKTLIVVGSNDPLCDFSYKNRGIVNSLLALLPPHARFEIIRGGTHNNFASYSGPMEFNGLPGVSRERQHRIAVEKTVQFLETS